MITKQDVTLSFSVDDESGPLQSKVCPDKSKRLSKRPPLLSYEVFVSILHYSFCAIAIIDRFAWNTWPRQTYQIGRGSAGSDKMDGLKPGPWSVAMYDILARTSGRYAILAYNFLLLTRMESVEWLFAETFIAKKIIDCRNIVNANIRMHRWNGIALCVFTLLHVWSILFPVVFHGYQAKLVVGLFEWPISERTPPKCDYDNYEEGCWPGDTDPDRKTMGLQADDVFRMIEMTIFLAILMPISVRWLVNRWHAAIHLHRFIHVIYFVDIVRRHSHPHSWILNTPVFVLFYLDKWLFSLLHKRNNLPVVKRVKLSDDFMVLYWKSPFGTTDTIGPDYALRLHGTPVWEDKHVFTCFENRTGLAFNDEVNGDGWDVGVVIRVFRNKRTPRLGEKYSHTRRMYHEGEKDGLKMLITGPRQGEMSEIIKFALVDKPVVLIGAGSAINYIIDAIQYCANDPPLHPVKIVYSTRDKQLFNWCFETMTSLMETACEGAFHITLAYTGGEIAKIGDNESEHPKEETEQPTSAPESSITAVDRRLVIEDYLYPGSVAFCQGSGGLKNAVEKACREIGAAYHGGLGGGS